MKLDHLNFDVSLNNISCTILEHKVGDEDPARYNTNTSDTSMCGAIIQCGTINAINILQFPIHVHLHYTSVRSCLILVPII